MSLETKFDDEGDYSETGNNTIYDLELILAKSLNDFNSVYAQYLRCSNTIKDNERDPDINNVMNTNTIKTNCYSSPTQIDLINSYNILKKNIEVYNNAFYYIQNNAPDISKDTPINMVDLEVKYKEVLNLRKELDIKNAEMNRGKDSEFNEFKQRYDSTIYIKILLTILLLSILYYFFLHM